MDHIVWKLGKVIKQLLGTSWTRNWVEVVPLVNNMVGWRVVCKL